MTARGMYYDANPLANVTLMGVLNSVSKVSLNGNAITNGWSYNDSSKTLTITELNNLTINGAWSQDWSLSWS